MAVGTWSPPSRVQVAVLQAAFPSCNVSVSTFPGGPARFEVAARGLSQDPWCLISDDVTEIRHELEENPRGLTPSS
jgi:hypothetical protein